MIAGDENIARIFSIFHDGSISYLDGEDTLNLEVDISYLAERIDPSYSKFNLSLYNIQEVKFFPWQDVTGPDRSYISGVSEIFKADLEIFRGEAKDGVVVVSCTEHSGDFPFSGGDLSLRAGSATVKDESGRIYTLEELSQLCSGYWSDWSSKKEHS